MEVIDEGLAPGDNQNNDLNELIANGYDFDFGKYISDGFDVFKKEAGSFIGFGILSGLIIALAGMIPFGGVIVSAPLTIGYSIYAHKVAHDHHKLHSVGLYQKHQALNHLLFSIDIGQVEDETLVNIFLQEGVTAYHQPYLNLFHK